MDTTSILALIVAIISAFGVIFTAGLQVSASRKLQENELFFHSMLKVYSTLLESIIPESVQTQKDIDRALQNVITAIQPAILLSRNEVATYIRSFYFTYCDYIIDKLNEKPSTEKIERFREQFWILQDCLRDEMYKFAPKKRRRLGVANSRWQDHNKSNHATSRADH